MGMLLWVLYRGHPNDVKGRLLHVVLKDDNLGLLWVSRTKGQCQTSPSVLFLGCFSPRVRNCTQFRMFALSCTWFCTVHIKKVPVC